MNAENIKTVAVIGAGDMGHGIAEIALLAEYKVFLCDVSQDCLGRGLKRIDDSLGKLVAKGKVSADLYGRIRGTLLTAATSVEQAVRQAGLVIEAIPEVLDLKKRTFSAIDASAPPDAILASNTSTMSITEIAAATNRPAKVLGLHFFNPAVLMPTVEVILAERTSAETFDAAYSFCEKCGKKPVRVNKDVPGFIVNRILAPGCVLVRCFLDANIATPEEIDATVRNTGAPMGPCETMDYTGLDINLNAANYFAQTVHPDYAPGRVLEDLVRRGDLGKKTGKGLYDWSAGRPVIDLTKITDKFDPADLLAVNANEATRLVEMSVASAADIDRAMIGATGVTAGPLASSRSFPPADLAARLNKLAERFHRDIFRPSQTVVRGTY